MAKWEHKIITIGLALGTSWLKKKNMGENKQTKTKKIVNKLANKIQINKSKETKL